ncbi:MAG: HU family DNA-binding protein [Acidobacteriota bacterium]
MAGKADIVEQVARQQDDLTKKQVAEIFDAIFDSISVSLANNERVQIPGFGSFSVSHREAREGRNPSTGAAIQIAASTSARFKQGKDLKERLNA